MQEQIKDDEIILGVGHGYLNYAEDIISAVKHMRSDINSSIGRDFPRVHILDHDLDSEGKTVWLKQTEYIIRIKGVEKARNQYDEIQSNAIVIDIVTKLKNLILDNISLLSERY